MYEATYYVSVTITVDGGVLSGVGTFEYGEIYLTDLPVTGSLDATGNVFLTLYGVDGDDMEFSGGFEGDGSMISGTWTFIGGEGYGMFYFTREEEMAGKA